jgi:hypothetical protein
MSTGFEVSVPRVRFAQRFTITCSHRHPDIKAGWVIVPIAEFTFVRSEAFDPLNEPHLLQLSDMTLQLAWPQLEPDRTAFPIKTEGYWSVLTCGGRRTV